MVAKGNQCGGMWKSNGGQRQGQRAQGQQHEFALRVTFLSSSLSGYIYHSLTLTVCVCVCLSVSLTGPVAVKDILHRTHLQFTLGKQKRGVTLSKPHRPDT